MFDKTVVRVIISKGESMYADVLVEVKTKDLEKMFTYRVPDSMVLSPGMRVLVPFGKRNIEGFVMKIYDYGDFDYEVRDIVSAIDERAVINEEMMELGKYHEPKFDIYNFLDLSSDTMFDYQTYQMLFCL